MQSTHHHKKILLIQFFSIPLHLFCNGKTQLTEFYDWCLLGFLVCCGLLHDIYSMFDRRNGNITDRSSFFRSSRPLVFLGKCVLKTCCKFTGEHLCQSVTSIKLLCNLLEIALWHGCPKNTYGRLLLIFL